MPTDTLHPKAVLPLLRTSFGRPYRYTNRCESTQDLLDPDAPEGALAVAEEQTAGRGRRGRAWSAPAGEAILCSVMLRPPPTRLAAQTSLLGGLAAARALSDASSCAVRIKWPNDVLVGRRKVAGVLAEASDGHVVLGFGLNINQAVDSFPVDLRESAGSLRTLDGRSRTRAPILAGLLAALQDVYGVWSEHGFAAVTAELAELDALRGLEVQVGSVGGTAAGLDDDGRLLVTREGRCVAIDAGEVSVPSVGW